MQNDSSTCRRLRARHDKQYWGWMSAKCAATDCEAAEPSSYSILESNPFLPHNTALIPPLVRVHSSTRTHDHESSYCTVLHACRASWMATHPLLTRTLSRTEWKMHAVNFQLCLSASFLTTLLSSHPTCAAAFVLPLTNGHLSSSSSSLTWRCLVNLVLLYGTDTQLVVGALTRPEKKRLGLLQTEALNRKWMGFIGLQGLSYSQTIQLICQGDPNCSSPSLWFVHASVCLQSRHSSMWGSHKSGRLLGTRKSIFLPPFLHIFSFDILQQSGFKRKEQDKNTEKHPVIISSLVSIEHLWCHAQVTLALEMHQYETWFWQLLNTCCLSTERLWFT